MKRPLTPLDFIRRAIKLYPERTAVLHGDLRFSYRQWGERIWRLAHALKDAGVRPGDHVAVLSPNTHQGLLTYAAVPWTGAVLVPLNTRLSPAEYAFQLDFADVKLLLCDVSLLERAREVAEGLGITVWEMGDGEAEPGLESRLERAPSEPLPFPVGIDEDSPITINFTSGTTNNPKGVMLTHRNAYMDGLGVLMYLKLDADSVYLHTLPNFHVNGWGGVWAVQGVGAANVALPQVRGDAIYEAIGRHGVTHLCAAPTVLGMITDPACARSVQVEAGPPILVATAGSPPHARTITDMDALGFTVLQVYGLSETSPLITVAELSREQQALPIQERAALIARQGFEMVNAGEVEVMTPDLQPVPHDGETLGEIMVQSNHVMLGYYKNPQATAEAFAGGWFHTGDLACIHADGRIEIRDRNKDVIISGGENISSVEVEGVLYRHPSVREAVVVAMPDAHWGEVPCAFVALHAGQQASPEDLTAFAREHLAGFKVPKRFEYLDDLPKTASGKFQKFILRNTLWDGQTRAVN